MQLGRSAHDAIFHVGDDERTVSRAFGGVTLNETIVHEAIEAVMPALPIQPEQVIAQQRQLFVLAQGPHIAEAGSWAVFQFV
jgi:hypothetical protein